MLLRTDLHVRPRVRLPRLVRLREREEEAVSASVDAADTTHAEGVGGDAPARREELFGLLAAQRGRWLEFLRRRVRSGADAEDLLQQAMLRASTRLDALRAAELLEPWFYRVLRSTLADHHTTWAIREAKLQLLAAEAQEATPEEVATCACGLGLLDRLRPEYRDIVRRVDLEDERLADVALSLGVTVNNATVRLHRARKALREALLDRCGTTSAKACSDCGCE